MLEIATATPRNDVGSYGRMLEIATATPRNDVGSYGRMSEIATATPRNDVGSYGRISEIATATPRNDGVGNKWWDLLIIGGGCAYCRLKFETRVILLLKKISCDIIVAKFEI